MVLLRHVYGRLLDRWRLNAVMHNRGLSAKLSPAIRHCPRPGRRAATRSAQFFILCDAIGYPKTSNRVPKESR
jgi:hypothetical protein